MIADPFDGAGNGDDVDRGGDRPRVFHHVRNQLTDDRFEFGVDLGIGTNDRSRLFGIKPSKGIQCLTHHDEGGFGKMPDANAELRRNVAIFVNAAHPLGNLLGLVTGPFQVSHNLADAQHQAQIGSRRLALGDDVGAVVVNGFFKLIHFVVGIDNALDAANFTGGVGIHRRRNLGFNHTAHLQDMGAEATEVFVELAGEVLAFVHFNFLISFHQVPKHPDEAPKVPEHAKANSPKCRSWQSGINPCGR